MLNTIVELIYGKLIVHFVNLHQSSYSAKFVSINYMKK